jgi:post-segregation antitoxin (ccd killing protein)
MQDKKPIQVYMPSDKKAEALKIAKKQGLNISSLTRLLLYREIERCKAA